MRNPNPNIQRRQQCRDGLEDRYGKYNPAHFFDDWRGKSSRARTIVKNTIFRLRRTKSMMSVRPNII